MPNVFISYSRDSQDYAQRLGAALKDSWAASFIDQAQLSLGESFHDVIRAKMQSASAFVVLLTQRAIESQWILFELGVAQALGKPIILLLLGDVDVDRLDYLLRETPNLDARHLTPEEAAQRIKSLVEL